MILLLLTLSVSAPPDVVAPIPPALVPPTAVAGAAVVLGVDAEAMQRSKTLAVFDEGTLRELQATDVRFGRLRREMSLERGGRRSEVVRAEERHYELLQQHAARQPYRLWADRQQKTVVVPRAAEDGIPPGCLVLILPPERVHPVIREALRK